MVTPTGAAILAAVSEGYGDMPMMRADHVGYGAGPLRPDFPNALRIVIGEEQRAGAAGTLPDLLAQGEVLIQTTLDELGTGQCERLIDELTEAGAGDAWITSVVGRGGRPRLLASALAPAERRDQVILCLRDWGAGADIRISPVSTAPTA